MSPIKNSQATSTWMWCKECCLNNHTNTIKMLSLRKSYQSWGINTAWLNFLGIQHEQYYCNWKYFSIDRFWDWLPGQTKIIQEWLIPLYWSWCDLALGQWPQIKLMTYISRSQATFVPSMNHHDYFSYLSYRPYLWKSDELMERWMNRLKA